jgi:hypothetical protein
MVTITPEAILTPKAAYKLTPPSKCIPVLFAGSIAGKVNETGAIAVVLLELVVAFKVSSFSRKYSVSPANLL